MLLPLQGEGLFTLVPRALPWAGNWRPFQGARGGFELIEFLQRGCGAAPQFDVGLRRRNNELNELTNCRAARVRRFRINRIFAVQNIRAALHGLKAQQVPSPGQRPGYHVPFPYAL